MTIVSVAVEGLLDEAVVARLCTFVGLDLGGVYGRRGRPHVLQRLASYNQAARHYPWMVLADLDNDVCAPDLIRDVLPAPAPFMRFRVAVREVESWLLGDRDRIAAFLSIPRTLVHVDPEAILDPKAHVLELARHSRSRERRRQMLPPGGLGNHTGPAYTASMIEFAAGPWRPDVAAGNVNSLDRAIRAMQSLDKQT